MKPLLTVTDEAAAFLAPKLQGFAGVHVLVNKKGCAGGEYEFTPLKPEDVTRDMDATESNGIKIYFPKILLLSLIGSELTLVRDQFNTRLDFRNPNELSRCGCGESIALPHTH